MNINRSGRPRVNAHTKPGFCSYWKFFLLAVFLSGSASGQSIVLWDESVDGKMSDNYLSPTALGTVQKGSDSVLGSVQIIPTGNENYLTIGDYFTFSVPVGLEVQALQLSIDKPDVWIWLGPNFSTMLGFTYSASNGDLLTQYGLSPLNSGSYSMYIENHDAGPTTSTADYTLGMVVQQVPEPGSLVFLTLGGWSLLARRKRRLLTR